MSSSTLPPGLARRALDRDNPWPGLLEYREEDQAFFRGRDREAEELRRRVMSHRTTLLIASSGTGKTSLVKAGLLPRLEADVLPVYVRLDHSAGAPTLSDQVLQALANEAQRRHFDVAHRQAQDGLWEHLHRKSVVFWTSRNQPGLPLIILDQFEELFTLGAEQAAAERSAAFRAELADLVEGQPPVAFKQRIESDPAIGRLFDFHSHHYRVLLTLREDYLPEMETLRLRSPVIMDSRFRLGRMSGGEALKVVEVGEQVLAAGIAETIVRFVAGGSERQPLDALAVEPFLLSLLCAELNRRRRKAGLPQVTADLLKGSQAEILETFYETCLGAVTPAERRILEETLVLETGHRDTRATFDLRAQGVSDRTLSRLVDLRLLRSEERGGVPRVELTHDVLAPLVTASRKRRRDREEQEAREAKALAEAAERERRASEEQERREAQTRAELELARVRAEETARRLRWTRWFALMALTLLGLAVWRFVDARRAREALKEENRRLEAATIRLSARMKLRIAPRLGSYSSPPQVIKEDWYKIATDHTRSIVILRGGTTAQTIGTGFVVKGSALSSRWSDRPVLVTASGLLQPDETQISGYLPGVDNQPVRLKKTLWSSPGEDLAISVVEIEGDLPFGAIPISRLDTQDLSRLPRADPSDPARMEPRGSLMILAYIAMGDSSAQGFQIAITQLLGRGVPASEVDGPINLVYTHATGGGAMGAPIFDADTGALIGVHLLGHPFDIKDRPRLGEGVWLGSLRSHLAGQ